MVVVAAVAVISAAGGTDALASTGCTAANSGSFNTDLSAGTSVTRELALDAGDTLGITAGGASATLISGASSPLTLIAAGGTTAGSLRAPQADTFAVRFAAGPATIRISCTSAQSAAADAAFLARRNDLVKAQEPDRIRLDRSPTPIANADKPLASTVDVDEEGRPRQVAFSVSLSEITAAAGQKPQPGLVDLWLEGRMQNYAATAADLGPGSGNLGILYFGTRSMIGPDILVGALAQLDRGVETARYAPAEIAASGWMAGPYLSMRLLSGVTFDGRAAWGETENADNAVEIGETLINRRLMRAKLTGTREVEGWKVAPSVGLVYLEDAVRDDTTGTTKAAGTGRIEVLPEVSRRFAVDGDTFIEPRAAVGGFVGFDEFSALKATTVTTGNAAEMHLKAEAGVAVGVKEGSSLQATGGVESASSATPETWTGRLQLKVPLGN
ncbi:MAG: hypothetical protein ACXWJU_04240 [Hyphomicrobium sp.]